MNWRNDRFERYWTSPLFTDSPVWGRAVWSFSAGSPRLQSDFIFQLETSSLLFLSPPSLSTLLEDLNFVADKEQGKEQGLFDINIGW